MLINVPTNVTNSNEVDASLRLSSSKIQSNAKESLKLKHMHFDHVLLKNQLMVESMWCHAYERLKTAGSSYEVGTSFNYYVSEV